LRRGQPGAATMRRCRSDGRQDRHPGIVLMLARRVEPLQPIGDYFTSEPSLLVDSNVALAPACCVA